MSRVSGRKHSLSVRTSASRGFTLVEVVVVLAIFMVIIVISSQAFNAILSLSTQQTKSAESDTQGIIGLEMLRVDLEHAGYGLPWATDFVADFDEAQPTSPLAPGIDSKDFNDANNASDDSHKVPRAIQAGSSSDDHRDYLVIKSTLVGIDDAAKKWTYVEGLGTLSSLKKWDNDDDNLVAEARVITINSRTKRLIGTGKTDFSYKITAPDMTPAAGFQPQQDTDFYVVYGVSDNKDLLAPYNRVDYFVKRPTDTNSIPARCADKTGILYKAVMSHNGGGFASYPLIECVADMQIVFALDSDGDGTAEMYLGEDGLSALSAKDIRSQLKEIQVYIVAHEGGKDFRFNYPKSEITVGEHGVGRVLNLATYGGTDYNHFRWKTYKITVIPKNLNY